MTTPENNNNETTKSPELAPAPLWNRMQELGTTGSAHPEIGTTNPMVFVVGLVAIVGLAVLCFSMALSNSRHGAAASSAVNGNTYIPTRPTNIGGPGGPVRISTPTAFTSPRQPVTLTAPPMPVPVPSSPSTTWSSSMEKDRVAGLLGDCRIAYQMSGELSQRWMTAVNNSKAPAQLSAVSSPGNQDTSRPLTNEDWNTIDGQIDAIDGTIALATQPSRYPEALQDTSMDLGREMRTYLQTTREALSATDPQVRSELQSRASTHHAKAGELLGKLEASLQERVSAAPSY